MTLDFTKPWLRGKKVIPRKGDEPPRLESMVKIVPIKDDAGNTIVAKVVHGTPGRKDPWIEAEFVENKHTAEKGKK